MRKQILVLGLGQFGMSVVRSLAELDLEVIAVDLREDLVEVAAEFAHKRLVWT